MSKKMVVFGGCIVTGLIGLMFLFSCLEVIPAGFVGVQYSPRNGVQEEVLTQGWRFISPFDKVTEYSIATEQLYLSSDSREGSKDDDSFNVVCKDGTMRVDLEMSYSFDTEQVSDVYSRYRGLDGENIVNTIVRGKIKTKVSEVTSKYSVLDAYMNKKAELNVDITTELKSYLSEFGIVVESANITNAVVDDKIEQTITERSTVAQQLEVEKMNQEKAKLQAETNLITAQGKNTVMLEEAQAQADALIIEAQAEAEANALKNASLTELLVQNNTIEKWNGTLPQVTGADNTIIDIGG